MMTPLAIVRQLIRHPVGRLAPVKTLLRYAHWQIRRRIFRSTQVVPFVHPTRILVGGGMRGGYTVSMWGMSEFYEMGFLAHAARPGDLFVDVGANVGMFTLLAAGVAGADAVAFEPGPTAFRRLGDNVQLNRLGERVTLHHAGVGSAAGTLSFAQGGSDTLNHVVRPEDGVGEIQVPVVRLDDAVESGRTLFLKVDVEGWETPVIEGALTLLGQEAPVAVVMELNGSASHYGFDEDSLHRKMLDLGFETADYDPFTRLLRPTHGERQTRRNTLFVKPLGFFAARAQAGAPFQVLGHTI